MRTLNGITRENEFKMLEAKKREEDWKLKMQLTQAMSSAAFQILIFPLSGIAANPRVDEKTYEEIVRKNIASFKKIIDDCIHMIEWKS